MTSFCTKHLTKKVPNTIKAHLWKLWGSKKTSKWKNIIGLKLMHDNVHYLKMLDGFKYLNNNGWNFGIIFHFHIFLLLIYYLTSSYNFYALWTYDIINSNVIWLWKFSWRKTYVYLINDLHKSRFLGMCDELPIECSPHNHQALNAWVIIIQNM